MRRRMSPSRAATSSVRPSARYASVVSAERLSKYSTATLFGAGTLTGRVAVRHGGGAPSGHWAASRRAAVTPRSATAVACRFIAAPPLAARLPGGAETGDRPGSGRIGDSGDGPIGPSLAVARVPADRWLALPHSGRPKPSRRNIPPTRRGGANLWVHGAAYRSAPAR